MHSKLLKAWTKGTHRQFAPELTFKRIQSRLGFYGITRCANVTGLDHVGIPVFCAIRPRGRLLQVANGKGSDIISAKVSALMEAIEFYHYEHPGENSRVASLNQMREVGSFVIEPQMLSQFRQDVFFSSEYLIGWEPGEELISTHKVWVPTSSVRIHTPMLYPFSSNGIGAGNHIVEATLHGLYELIERDSISRLNRGGKIRLQDTDCHCVDLNTIFDIHVNELLEKLRKANIKLVLISVKSCVKVQTFWAVLLESDSLGNCSQVNVGYGTHKNVSVAATRAITEAAQSRITFIHGAREDLRAEAYQNAVAHGRLFRVFDELKGIYSWDRFTDNSSDDLNEDCESLIAELQSSGYETIIRVPYTKPSEDIQVVKMFVPGLQMKHGMF